jgi:hypothetical protein
LIYDEGYTIDGAKKRLSSEKASKKPADTAPEAETAESTEPADIMQTIKNELKEISNILSR